MKTFSSPTLSESPARPRSGLRGLETGLRIATVALALGTSGVLITGCAATRTSKSTGEYIDDAAITAKVKAALVQDPVVSALQVNVDTYKGIVQLNGFVDTQEEKSRAEQVARTVPGVSSVQNKLTVKTATQR